MCPRKIRPSIPALPRAPLPRQRPHIQGDGRKKPPKHRARDREEFEDYTQEELEDFDHV